MFHDDFNEKQEKEKNRFGNEERVLYNYNFFFLIYFFNKVV